VILTPHEIKNLSKLAALELNSSDMAQLPELINQVLKWFHQLDVIDLEKVDILFHSAGLENRFHPDNQSLTLPQEIVLSQVPKKEKGLICSPPIL